MKTIMISILRHARYRKFNTSSLQPFLCGCAAQKTNVNTQTKIEIPKRIERGPTDILEALASTVGRDPTAQHYKFPDDPHFNLKYQSEKRSMALAIEAGRKAAWWVVEEKQELFKHKVADPLIKAFLPPSEGRPLEGMEENLLRAIDETRVLDAIQIYESILKNNTPVENESKQKLLELCCFFNCMDHDDERLIESKWYTNTEEEVSYKSWQSDGFAENLFVEMENDPKAVCAIIQGRLKYNDVIKGYELYKKAIVEDIPLTTEVYNGLIGATISLKQRDDERWKLILDFLREMSDKQIPVNIGTLNSSCKVISNFGRLMRTEDTLLPLLAEFRQLGITASLGTYYYIIKHFATKFKKFPNGLMDKIISELEGKKFEIQHESDMLFFPAAMRQCVYSHDSYLGLRLHEVVLNGQNYNFIADNLSESNYYKYFFELIFTNEPIEKAMEIYSTMVPRIYTPENYVFQKIIETVSENGAIEYFPVIWADMAALDIKNLKLFEIFSRAMVANPPAANEFKDFYSKVATHIVNVVDEGRQRERTTLNWSSELISNLLTLYIRAGQLEGASKLFKFAEKDVTLEISTLPLSEYLELCISQQKTSLAMDCLQYSYERGTINVIEMAKRIKSELVLDDEQASFVQQAMEA